MLEKILNLVQKLDLKWWISLKAQQMLTILMAVFIVVFFSTTVMLFILVQTRVDEERRIKHVQIDKIQLKLDDCQESKYRTAEKYELLFFEARVIKEELKKSVNENTDP